MATTQKPRLPIEEIALIAAQKIQRFTAGMTLIDFMANEIVQSAVIRELQVIGKAAHILMDNTRATHIGSNWQVIAGMYDQLLYKYFAISNEIVWTTVQTNIPPLIVQLEQYVSPDPGMAK